MQIDVHHTTTYVAARLAGFEQRKVEIIAYAAQYVDDASGKTDMDKIRNLFVTTGLKDGKDRHKVWLQAIKDGVFSFGPEEICYMGKKRPFLDKSWKEQALGETVNLLKYTYRKSFLQSNWKLFHDAIQAHRFYVINELLPQYGICAA